jgi:hypothetical protein
VFGEAVAVAACDIPDAEHLSLPSVEVYLWRPRDFEAVHARLTGEAPAALVAA